MGNNIKKGSKGKRGPKAKTSDRPPRPQQRENFKDDDHLTDSGANSRDNDWRWYAQSPELIRDYASYPFGYPVGAPTDVKFTSDPTQVLCVPGFMTLYFQPTIGYADQENSPINVAMRKFYTEVRKANSGATNYEAPDMMMYLVAMDSVFMYVAMVKRLYGLLIQATPLNRYYTKALVQAMGVNYSDVIKHIPDLRGFINLMCAKANALCVPNSLSYMARHSWMCEGLYLDSNTSKAQTYFYMPTDFYTLGQTTTEQPATNLVYKEWIPDLFLRSTASGWGTLNNFDSIVNMGWELLNVLIEDQAMNIMSGDILKAFGPEGVIRLVGIPDEYIVLPSYSPEVSSQIENATVFGAKLADAQVTQDLGIGKGYITCTPKVQIPLRTTGATTVTSAEGATGAIMNLLNSARFLNMHHDGVTPEEVMVATRLMNIPDDIFTNPWVLINGQGSVKWITLQTKCHSIGSEVIVGAQFFRFSTASSGAMGNLDGVPFYTFVPHSLAQTAMWTVFDWAPFEYPMSVSYATSGSTATVNSVVPYDVVGDIDNYAILKAENLTNLSTVALLSEFWV